MKIVITGGFGFIGRSLTSFLQKNLDDVELHLVDWDRTGMALLGNPCGKTTIACFASDLAKPIYENADCIIHLAACPTVQESITNPGRTFLNNTVKTQRLLDHICDVAPNAHFIFASTGGAIIGDHDGPISENKTPRPKSPYGASKLAVEGLLSAYSGTYGLRSTSLRFSNVYGPNSERKYSVIATFCKSYLSNGLLVVNGDGLQTRDYVHVEDICRAILSTFRTRATGIFQLGTGIETSLLDLVATFKAIDPNRKIKVHHTDALSGEVYRNVCDISKARNELGFVPEIGLREGIASTLAWYQDRHLLEAAQ